MRHDINMQCKSVGLYRIGDLVRLQTPSGHMRSFRIYDTVDDCRIIRLESVQVSPQETLNVRATIFTSKLPELETAQ